MKKIRETAYKSFTEADEKTDYNKFKKLLKESIFLKELKRLQYSENDKKLIDKYLTISNLESNEAFQKKDDHCCIICLCELDESDDVIRLYCNHFYHKVCFLGWAKKKMSCAYCSSCVREVTFKEVIEQRTKK